MKNLLFINSGLPVNFWAKAIGTSNYFRNQFLIKPSDPAFIPEKAWIGIR